MLIAKERCNILRRKWNSHKLFSRGMCRIQPGRWGRWIHSVIFSFLRPLISGTLYNCLFSNAKNLKSQTWLCWILCFSGHYHWKCKISHWTLHGVKLKEPHFLPLSWGSWVLKNQPHLHSFSGTAGNTALSLALTRTAGSDCICAWSVRHISLCCPVGQRCFVITLSLQSEFWGSLARESIFGKFQRNYYFKFLKWLYLPGPLHES